MSPVSVIGSSVFASYRFCFSMKPRALSTPKARNTSKKQSSSNTLNGHPVSLVYFFARFMSIIGCRFVSLSFQGFYRIVCLICRSEPVKASAF